MKLTKTLLRQIIKEEMNIFITEEDSLDLSELEPTVEKAADDVLRMAQSVSREEEIQRMVIAALIAKLNELIK
jgi:hypothetical protein